MKLKFLVIAALPALFSMSAMAGNTVTMNFTGSIEASTCGVDDADSNVNFDFGNVGADSFKNNNYYPDTVITMMLSEKCDFENTKLSLNGDHSDDATHLNTSMNNLKLKLSQAFSENTFLSFDGSEWDATKSTIEDGNARKFITFPRLVKTGDLEVGSFTATATLKIKQL